MACRAGQGDGGGRQPEMPAETKPGRRRTSRSRFSSARPRPASTPRIGAEIGFVERLVWFWSNHFCVSADKVPSMAGAYEREAIRPHVLGRFADMLLAAESHPAMLFYLDNAASIGPNSVAGINRSQGPQREPGARDPGAAYARRPQRLHPGRRHCASPMCSPAGPCIPIRTIPSTAASSSSIRACTSRARRPMIGKSYPDTGVEQGRAVLADLARHPATADAHRAPSSRAHFVADEPPPAAGGAAGEDVPRHRRRSQGDGEDAGRRAGGLGRSRAPSSSVPSEWLHRRACAPPARDSRISQRVLRCAGAARRAAVAAAGAAGLLRPARRPGSTVSRMRLDIANAFARRGSAEQLDPQRAGRRRARPAGLDRDAADHRPRREPGAGAWRCC